MSSEIKTYEHIDAGLLVALPNPATEAYEIKIKVPEFTFLGVQEQPDFATIYMTFYPNKKIIELKALKLYVYQLRNIVVSYERLINIVFDHLMETYDPARLRLVMNFNPRGGISSMTTIDSDWKIRGGQDVYQHWSENSDTWMEA
jgi:7-cyano-7-deazaguanine reductase